VFPEELVEAEEVGFDDETNGRAGTEVFGGFEEGGCVDYKVVDFIVDGGGEARIEAVEAPEESIVDFIVKGVFVAFAVHGFGEMEWLFGRYVL
jgi:hypothetical protein